MTENRSELKQDLFEQLDRHGGETSHPDVHAAIQALIKQCPIAAPAYQHDALDGDWHMLNAPNFPNSQRCQDGRYIYALGDLAFNAFTPTDLQIVIDRVTQPVWSLGIGDQRRYDIVVEFTVIDQRGTGLQGIVRNLAVCQAIDEQTLGVSFLGGTLEPLPNLQADKNIDRWMALFSGCEDTIASSTSTPAPSLVQRLKTRASNLLLKLIFGLQPTSAIDEIGQRKFEMTRSPIGKLRLFYLDDDLRITCGEKEPWMVCQRLSKNWV